MSEVIDVFVNPVYKPIFTTEKRFVVIKGAAGSGKSRAVAQYLISCLLNRKRFRCLVMHKWYEGIRSTVYPELKDAIVAYGLSSFFKFKESPFSITHIETGNELVFKGLDDPEKLKSVSGIDMIWWEEATNMERDEMLQANARMRGDGNEHPYRFIMTFNPVDELHWLKSTFFEPGGEFEEDTLTLETTMRDNQKLDAAYYKTQLAAARLNPAWGRVYVDGDWGRLDTEGMFYNAFDNKLHTSDEAAYDPGKPLWASFDFNTMPSCTVLLFQMQSNNVMWQVDEITLKAPHNHTRDICKKFKELYPNHGAGLFVTGDPAGKHEDTRTEKGFNDYSIIKAELAAYRPIPRIATKAANQITRGNFINAIFRNSGPLWQPEFPQILVNKKCRKTIEDLMYQRATPDGKDKPKVKDKVTGITHEKLGHASDAFDYMVTMIWAQQFEDFTRGPVQVRYKLGKNKMPAKYSW